MLKPDYRPRLRPVVSLFLWFAIPVVSGLTVVPAVLEAVFPPLPVVAPDPPTMPGCSSCSRTLYYYDMAPFVRESVWCGPELHEPPMTMPIATARRWPVQR